MLCPNCFQEKGEETACPHCQFNENEWAYPRVLPYRTVLAGQYVVGRVLGKPGGFGVTYLGWDNRLQTKVAIKEYLPRDYVARDDDRCSVSCYSREDKDSFATGMEQFMKEAQVLAQFDHANIVGVRNFFEENGTAYMVMDYYEGVTLQEYVETKGGRLEWNVAIDVLMPVLDGLREMHNKGFLHRDIKPQNIYITENGRPILLDFGAARRALGERSRSLSVLMTPGFAPLEQYSTKGNQGPWTDVYACAATLYWLTTGQMPQDALERYESDELKEPASLVPGISGIFSQVIMMALQTDPAARPQNMTALQNMLMQCRDSGQVTNLAAANVADAGQQVAVAQLSATPGVAGPTPVTHAPIQPSYSTQPPAQQVPPLAASPNWFQQMWERLKTDAKARKIAAASVGALIFLIIITMYITIPKMSDVAKLKEQGNSTELCALIEKNGKYDMHADVMEGAAQAILDLNQPEAVKRLSAIVGNNKMSVKTRLGIVRQFKQHNQVVNQAGDFAVKGQVPEELRLALIDATNQVDRQAFDRRVLQELQACGQRLTSDIEGAIQQIKESYKYDINGTKKAEINTALYNAYKVKLQNLNRVGNYNDLRSVIQLMQGVECDAKAQQAVILNSITGRMDAIGQIETEFKNDEDALNKARNDKNAANDRAKAAAERAKDIISLRAFIIDRTDLISGDAYEVSLNLSQPYNRALLRTTQTSYTTRGWISIWVRKVGTQDVTFYSGYQTTVPVYEEYPQGDQLASERLAAYMELADASRVLSQLESNHNGKQTRIQMLKGSIAQEIDRL